MNRQTLRQARRFSSSYIPEKPTWDLIPLKKHRLDSLDVKKLEKLSMLTVDSRIEKNLNDVINVAERMSQVKIQSSRVVNSSLYFKYLGSNEIREDVEKLPDTTGMTNTRSDEWRDRAVLSNAKYKYEEYFIAPENRIKE